MNHRELHVKLASFEGPLDLLLYLIRQNEMDVRDIKIADITSHYLHMIDLMREHNLDIAGDFILMAANLILLKSRHILPQELEEEDLEEEPFLSEEMLRKRLLEHQRYQEVAMQLKEIPRMDMDYFKHPVEKEKNKKHSPMLMEMSLTELCLAFQKVLSTARAAVQKVQKEPVSMEEAIRCIYDKISMQKATELYELIPEHSSRSKIVAVFLSILELTRLQKISILQHAIYGSIYVVGKEKFSFDGIDTMLSTGGSYEYEIPQIGD